MGDAGDEARLEQPSQSRGPSLVSHRPEADEPALARFAATHPAQLLAIATGLAYLFGYVYLRLIAEGLQVAPGDLGLSTNDYVMSAAMWLILFSPFIAAYAAVQRLVRFAGWRSTTGFAVAAGAVGTAVAVVLIVALSTRGQWVLAILLAIGVAVSVGWWIGGPGPAAVLTVAISLAGLTGLGAFQWGRQLARQPATSTTAPIYAELVLAVEEGTAIFSAGTMCVMRVSDRVYVSADFVLVEPAAVPFQPGDCFPTP